MENNVKSEPFKKGSKRKSKNSRFLRNVKKDFQRGIGGRGTRIDDDNYSYFINILDAMKVATDDVEEKVTMANNVFDQTIDQEEHMASNQIVCKALEVLVGFVDADKLERFLNAFSRNLRPICSDRFASHVLQKLMEIAFLRAVAGQKAKTIQDKDKEEEAADELPNKRAKLDTKQKLLDVNYNLETEFTSEHRTECGNFVLRVSKFLLNNLEDFVWDRCANHLTRTAILCLVGVHVPKVAFEKASPADIADIAMQTKNRYQVPAEWLSTMQEFAQRLEMWPHFKDFPYEILTSALTGIICIALRVVDKQLLKHFGKRLLMEAFLKTDDNEEEEKESDTVKLPKVFDNHYAIMCLETLICVAGPKLFNQIFAMLFTTRCAYLAETPLTNFAVQRLLKRISEREDFERVFDELKPELEKLLQVGHTSVVCSLAEACLRLGAKQAPLLLAMQQALHTTVSKNAAEDKSIYFFQCLVKLKPYEVVIKEQQDNSNSATTTTTTATTFVHLHGSLLVQHALEFKKPIFLVNSILATPTVQLFAILNTANGSHIADAFMRSKFVGEKSRERFIRLLDGFYVDLAITKFGSRVVEACFFAAQEGQKAYVAKQLAEKYNMLCGSPFGRLVSKKLRIETYRSSVAQWREGLKTQNTTNKAQELFKDIIK